MAEYVSVAEARALAGMRLICAEGLPGPWAESIKGILDVKKIPYRRGRFVIGGDHTDLIAWSAQASSPVIAWNDEFPLSNWSEQLWLAERLEPDPPLVPSDITERMRMFGYCNEICGRGGFGWSRRLMLIHDGLSDPELPEENRAFLRAFGEKYGYSPEAGEAAPTRVVTILKALTALLESQRAEGRAYFMGGQFTALDIYWAGFSHLIDPMPPELNPMREEFRPMYQNHDPAVAAAAKSLMEHRDFIYREHLVLPIDL